MENFITGYPANEEAQRQVVREILGDELYEFFFDRFLKYFFTENDANFLKSLGFNLLRVPLNYRHFEDDMSPMKILRSGFRRLDSIIDICAKKGIYTIIDLHALPGYQNQDWHSDNPTHKALFWSHRHFQDRVVNLWEEFAERYKGNPWIAGYNPINEPADPTGKVIMRFYDRLVGAIRAIDPYHIIFLEGNRYSRDFSIFNEPQSNIVYSVHDYPFPGRIFGEQYPGLCRGRYFDKNLIERDFLDNCRFMFENDVPIWVGEFGPVYTGRQDVDGWRYQVLIDQLEIYKHYNVNWSIWTYKDIGLQGIVYAASNSRWVERIRPIIEKKARLGADSWGTTDKQIRSVIEPFEKLIATEFPNYNPFPAGPNWQVKRLLRHILLSEPLLSEFGERLRGATKTEIDEMMKSFQFEKCIKRTKLVQILAEHCGAGR